MGSYVGIFWEVKESYDRKLQEVIPFKLIVDFYISIIAI